MSVGVWSHTFAMLAVAGMACVPTLAAAAPLGANARAALAAGKPVSVLVEYDSSAADRSIAMSRAARHLMRDDADLSLQRQRAYGALKSSAEPSLIAQGAVKERDYAHLPLTLWRIASLTALSRLEQLPPIKMVHENTLLRPVSVSDLGFISQPQAAAEGGTGAGTTIAVIDGGLGSNYLNFSDFGTCTDVGQPAATCRVVYDQDFYTGTAASTETVHGTNVSAIALGVATQAKLAMFDVFSGASAKSSDVLSAIDSSISLQATYNIVAINMSLGDGTSNPSQCTSSVYRSAAASAAAAGITLVAAAGNSGSKSGLGNPACTPGVVSVGAVYDAGYGTIEWDASADAEGACTDVSAADLVTCFSQSAGYLTVLAPGTFVDAPNSSFQQSGTSQATPHISGSIAVLRARYPAEPLAQTVQRLQTTGPQDIDPANGMASHRLNLLAAVNQGTALSLSGTGTSTAVLGAKATYTLTASNAGPLIATNVRIVNTLPAGAQFVSASSGCSFASGTVTCSAADLAADANITFTITVLWTSSGPVYDAFGLTADQTNTAPASQQRLVFGVATSGMDDGSDAPMPLWAQALLASLLFGFAIRRLRTRLVRVAQ